MGDMTDYYLDSLFAHELEDWEEEFDRERQCDYCGRRGLHWAILPTGKWRLHNEHGKIHSCAAHPSRNKREHTRPAFNSQAIE